MPWLAAVLFLGFGLKLLWDARAMDADVAREEEKHAAETIEKAERQQAVRTAGAVIREAFVLVFLAELGDRTQFTTIFLATAPAFTFAGRLAGALLGHGLVTGLAVGAGQWIRGRLSEQVRYGLSGILFLLFGLLALQQALSCAIVRMPRPYQPSLLRLLHGATALLVLGTWCTGLLVYSRFDGRWGRLPLALSGEWIDIHGSVAVVLWPLALLFALYALTLGRRRLRHPANALALVALALAVGSGKLMEEDWLREGDLGHGVYAVHLLAWLALAGAVSIHVGSVLARGGWPLARSMGSLQLRAHDRPGDWLSQIRRHFSG